MGRGSSEQDQGAPTPRRRSPVVIGEDQRALLRRLARARIKLIVIGGVAAQFFGWKSATKDLDITISVDASNVERFNEAIADIVVSSTVGGLGTVFETRHGRLELVRKADGIGGYSDWLPRAQWFDIGDDLQVLVAHPDDVLRSKEAAGRNKDEAVLPQIRRDLLDVGGIDREDIRGPVAEPGSPSEAPAFLTKELGERPTDPAAIRIWEAGAQLILDFRGRWSIQGTETLGSSAVGDESRDRSTTEKQLARVKSRLEQARKTR